MGLRNISKKEKKKKLAVRIIMGTQSNKREQQKFMWISNSLHTYMSRKEWNHYIKKRLYSFYHSTNDWQITKSLKDFSKSHPNCDEFWAKLANFLYYCLFIRFQ